jgi:hypothetical protein
MGAKVSPTRLKGVKVISGEREVVTKAEAGTGIVTGTVGIREVTPTPPVVDAGTIGSTGAGKRGMAEFTGALACRPM